MPPGDGFADRHPTAWHKGEKIQMQPKDLSFSVKVYIQKPRWAYGYIILNFTMERKPWQHTISAANAGALKGGHSPWKVTELSSGFSSKASDIRQSSTRNL